MLRVIKIFFWVVLAAALLAFGLLVGAVKLLKPERLTPLTEAVANKMLNADVTIGRMELKMKAKHPFLNIEVDSLTIVSRDIKNLPKAARDTLPVWADTLVSIDRFSGGINLAKLATGGIYLNDVDIDGLQANLLIVNDKLNNYSIYESTDEEETEIPDIRIKSFALNNPKIIRYSDLSTGTYADVRLNEADLHSEKDTSIDYPIYDLKVKTNLKSPLLSFLDQNAIDFGCDGVINWEYKKPYHVALNDFAFTANFLRGKLNADLEFEKDIILNSFDIAINPISINEALDCLPDDLKQDISIAKGMKTDLTIGLNVALTEPYNLDTDQVPYAFVGINIPQCYFKWQQVDLRKLALDLEIDLKGSDFNAAKVSINNFLVAGPATTIELKGKLSKLMSDPLFDGSINGNVVLERLPSQLTQYLEGAMAKGTIEMNTTLKLAKSMLSRDNFHKIRAEGTVEGKNLYYLSADTQLMFVADRVHGKFGTNESGTISRKSRRDTSVTRTMNYDSLLTASVSVDTAHILADGLKMDVMGLRLGVGAQNKGVSSDTTAIIPMGGSLKVDRFSLLSLSDSAVFRLRELGGRITMRRYKGDAHLPLFILDAGIKRMATGDNSTRFMVSDAQLHARVNKLPDDGRSEIRKQTKAIADSIQKARPDIAPDSVYELAREIRRARTPHTGHKRIHAQRDSADVEIMDWGTTRGMRRFLLDWNVRGTLTAQRAGLFTSSFPVRNRVENFNLKFNNDSIVLENVGYKAGQSDFLISGSVSNLKRALTSRQGRQPLKVVFDLLSDTINVNELANAFFTGAGSAGAALKGDLDDEQALEHDIEAVRADSTSGPLLIPVNIDAEFNMKANHVLYSDFILDNLTGKALMYQGALNLSDLRAASNVGSIDLSALYAAPTVKDMRFGFAMDLRDFNIRHFLNLVPAVDSLMPLMRDLGGIVGATIAATSEVDPEMNLVMPTLNAVINISGDSIVFLDEETFKKISKWLMFKDKQTNMIKHMSAEMVVENDMMQIFPFMFDFDRYTLGVQGHNDLDMNFDYHIAVLKSPIPFKFGINIKGNPDDFKVRLGKARFNQKESIDQVAIADTTRVNLIKQFQNVFRRGVRNSEFARLNINQLPTAASIDLNSDTITAADSLYFKQQGLLPDQ